MEILWGPWVRQALLDEGVLRFPLPEDLPMSWISAAETAGYLVAALQRPDLAGGEEFEAEFGVGQGLFACEGRG